MLVLCLGAGLAGCASLPSLENRRESMALVDIGDTRLGRAIARRVDAHPEKSGIYPLVDGREAFAARALLAHTAERTLDIQYYIWRNDMTGTLLFRSLQGAADRGVRVRLLLDDNNTSGLDTALAVLDAHPNIEVRLFNPFVIRNPRVIGYLTDFARLNRRMHNKSFTADNQATIIGGRNVGDEYFGATDDVLFADLDAMAIGPVVNDVSTDFDRYWSSQSSYPVDRLLPPPTTREINDWTAAASLIERDSAAVAYTAAIRNTSFVRDLLQGRLELEWAATRMVSDDPAKGLGQAKPEALLPRKLKQIIGEPAEQIDLVSPYFVPTAAGAQSFVDLARRGVKIKVLTNSLEATDVAAVHSGYAKWRKPLLEAGITLYERRLMTNAGPATADAKPKLALAGSGSAGSRPGKGSGVIGSSGSSLHAKTFSVDRSRAFIGSFNFDPRSAQLNTEMGFVIDSPALAQQIATAFDTTIPANAYEVRLTGNGRLYWMERRDGELVRYDTEPGTSFCRRAGVWFLSLLPIESLL